MSDADRESAPRSTGVRRAGRERRPRRPVVASGRRAARQPSRWRPGCATAAPPERGARPDLGMLALSAESVERTSLLAELRKEAAAGANGFYNYEVWECNRVAEGSATWRFEWRRSSATGSATPPRSAHPRRASGLHGDHRDRRALRVGCGGLRAAGRAAAGRARRGSLGRAHGIARPPAPRSRPRSCSPTRTPRWHEQGQNGDRYGETAVIGGHLGPARGDHVHAGPAGAPRAFLTTSQAQLEAELTEEMVEAYGERARDTQAVFFRRWGVDPWTRGYITGWRPGDVMSVGRCTARTSRRSTCAAPTSGSAATWRERCARAAPPLPPR